MGGGAIRAVAKMAGFTVPSAGLRGIPASSACRLADSLRPSAVVMEDLNLFSSNSEGSVQKSYSEVDDWVFNGGEEKSMPRVVFGGVPSIQEAKEATSELKAALEETYFSSSSSVGKEGSIREDDESTLVVRNKGCDTRDIDVVSAPAMMAFKLLKESPMAQNVVASIACDPNVYKAVLQNEELQKFLYSQQAFFSNSRNLNSPTELVADPTVVDQASTQAIDKSSDDEKLKPVNDGFVGTMLQKIMSSVVDMMNSLSGFFENLFGGKKVNLDGTSAELGAKSFMEASFSGLAIMAIMVILLKRA